MSDTVTISHPIAGTHEVSANKARVLCNQDPAWAVVADPTPEGTPEHVDHHEPEE